MNPKPESASMQAEANFHLDKDASTYAGASPVTGSVFIGALGGSAKLAMFMSPDQGRKIVAQLTAAIQECDDYAALVAKRAEAA